MVGALCELAAGQRNATRCHGEYGESSRTTLRRLGAMAIFGAQESTVPVGEGSEASGREEILRVGDDHLRAASELYFSRRGQEILIVEPETASWCLLSEPEWRVFRRIGGTTGPDETGGPWTRLSESGLGRSVRDIRYDDLLPGWAFYRLLDRLYQRNMISLNGLTYYEPRDLWTVQQYPHYYNLHMTEACNLACTYCRVYSPRKAPMMTPETCETIVQRTIEEIPSPTALIGFHGGEPMLNLKAIRAGAEEAWRAAARTGTRVQLLMQTNGTALSPKTVALLKSLNIEVGVSLDGPRAIHDSRRVFHSGEGSFDKVERGLQAAADGSLQTGFLAVVHEPEQYLEVLDHLVRERGARSMRINYTSYEGRAKDELEFPVERAERFAREWLRMVDYCEAFHAETGEWLDIADINLFIFHLISKQRPHMCYRSPCGIGNSILGFSHEGRIYLCDEVVGNPLFEIGSIHDTIPLKDLLDNSPVKRDMMARRDVENLSKCSSCTWKRFHGGGCTSKTYASFGTIDHDDPMCRFYHIVFEELMWRLWKKPELAHLSGHYGQYGVVEGAIHAMHM